METPGPNPTAGSRAAALLLPALLVAALGGCYRYSAADRGSVSAGDEVVLTVADEGGGAAAVDSARESGREVEGRVVEIGEGTIAVRTARPAADPFRSGATVVDTVRIGAGRVESIRRKELEAAKTAAVASGVALGLGIASVVLFESVGGGGDGTAPGDGLDRVLLPRR